MVKAHLARLQAVEIVLLMGRGLIRARNYMPGLVGQQEFLGTECRGPVLFPAPDRDTRRGGLIGYWGLAQNSKWSSQAEEPGLEPGNLDLQIPWLLYA